MDSVLSSEGNIGSDLSIREFEDGDAVAIVEVNNVTSIDACGVLESSGGNKSCCRSGKFRDIVDDIDVRVEHDTPLHSGTFRV